MTSYCLVDIIDAPHIVGVYDTLSEALDDRESRRVYHDLHTFRLVCANGIQELAGEELQRERASRRRIAKREFVQRQKVLEAERQKAHAYREMNS